MSDVLVASWRREDSAAYGAIPAGLYEMLYESQAIVEARAWMFNQLLISAPGFTRTVIPAIRAHQDVYV